MDKILDEIFKAYDIRGRVDSELKPEIIEKVGFVLGGWLDSDGAVAVGRDMRSDSQELANALILGLRKSGRDVVDIGLVTSDMIYFTVGNYDLAGGAMITASHNPGEYNGIKLCQSQARPIGIESGLLDIKELVKSADLNAADQFASLIEKDVTDDWINHVLSFVEPDKIKPLKIAVDAGNGMAGKIFPEIEPYLPLDVIEMYFDLDGTFPNHIANPLEPKNLVDIRRKIKEESCDLGLAFDGDGDRAVLIDENGEALSGSVMTAILAQYFLDNNKGATILYNAICGDIVKETIDSAGGKAIRTKVGHSYIKADMRTHDAVFAGEHSGHYYFKDNWFADSGLIAAIIAIYVLSISGKSLSEIAKTYRTRYKQIPETNLVVSDKEKTINLVREAYRDKEIDELDGLTVRMPGAWFNLRASNTEPLLRLNIEVEDEQRLEELLKSIQKIIQ